MISLSAGLRASTTRTHSSGLSVCQSVCLSLSLSLPLCASICLSLSLCASICLSLSFAGRWIFFSSFILFFSCHRAAFGFVQIERATKSMQDELTEARTKLHTLTMELTSARDTAARAEGMCGVGGLDR